MEPRRHGRYRVQDLTAARLSARGVPPSIAEAFARRGQATGLHPPLDEAEAVTVAGDSWLEWTRIYADEVELQERVKLSCRSCGEDLANVEAPCGHCGELDRRSERSWVPIRTGRHRSPEWLVFVHGMNTRGSWQEALAWELSLLAPRPTPVKIHKYGRVLWVLPRGRLRQRAVRFAEELHSLREAAGDSGRSGPGDVVAHSLGTWLIGHALRLDPTLCLGRVALTGSILTPDFEWDELVADGRVEAVSNLRASRDWEVAVTQFAIPDSGPSGRLGFRAECVVERHEPSWGHSTCFEGESNERSSPRIATLDAYWRPFFTWDRQAVHTLCDDGSRPRRWSASRVGRARRRVD